MNQTAPERTGWRDEKLSLRHRQWGVGCPAVDLDFLMVEFDRARVCCIVEYKNEFAAIQYASHPSYRAVIDLADRAGIPFIACRYASDFSRWRVTPLNEKAKKFLPTATDLSEKEFVELLYRMRGRMMPSDLFDCRI